MKKDAERSGSACVTAVPPKTDLGNRASDPQMGNLTHFLYAVSDSYFSEPNPESQTGLAVRG